MQQAPFTVHAPETRDSAVVFASPHSGRQYPDWFVSQSLLDSHAIRSSEDAFVDDLFDCAPAFGAPLLVAHAPRAFLDLNRAADELDPALIEGVRKFNHNPRVASGLGVIPRVVANGRPIYYGKMTLAEAGARIDSYWRPYHEALQSLLNESRAAFGNAILVDCHSMPREAVSASLRPDIRRPEIVIGDRFGAAAHCEIVEEIVAAFEAEGFVVARNAPFAGAYVTQAYGRPARRQHAIQVEIDRSLYMDEATITPHDGFKPFKARLANVIADITAIGRPAQALPLAAE
ncbi:N-formylglutamate amidohydrolase [Shimia sp. SK013]|uniref:N-formylglutamate amidohydrolase n=1 Tax=Shimia sp. SK013 TaxID=1389006 RepID=UPI0006B5B7B9|nr:N-formylglutamate amidohydrolase [Shimia sp. SK013]KPA20056.1 N-formylglutamate amidohydrolase [Shimia sp. SK013]